MYLVHQKNLWVHIWQSLTTCGLTQCILKGRFGFHVLVAKILLCYAEHESCITFLSYLSVYSNYKWSLEIHLSKYSCPLVVLSPETELTSQHKLFRTDGINSQRGTNFVILYHSYFLNFVIWACWTILVILVPVGVLNVFLSLTCINIFNRCSFDEDNDLRQLRSDQ